MTVAGPRNASTDERSGIRTYEWQGQKLPSVTSLRRLLGVPFPLATWMVEQAIGATMSHVANLDGMLSREGPNAVASFLRKEANIKRDTAANRGTAVHEAAAMGRAPVDVEPEVAGPLAMFYDFIQVTGAKIIMQERQVWNLSLGYAGSLDIMIEVVWNGVKRLLVVDLKTGKAIYVDHALQLMGYGLGEFVGQDDVIDHAATNMLHKANGLAILHLTDDSWELVEVKATPRLFEVFKNMVSFAHWQIETPNMDNLIARRWSK